jgi:hypothetical protein
MKGETTRSYNEGATRIFCRAIAVGDEFKGEVRVFKGKYYQYSVHSKEWRRDQRLALEDARELARGIILENGTKAHDGETGIVVKEV